jgi:hypothetical protein
MILLTGRNTALLEGLAQSLARIGDVRVADTLLHAEELRGGKRPTMLVVARDLLAEDTSRSQDMRGLVGTLSAVVTYHEAGEAKQGGALPPDVSRVVLADLELPLERNRLIALAEHLAGRARDRGIAPGAADSRPESTGA